MPRAAKRDTPPPNPDPSPTSPPDAAEVAAQLMARYEVVPITALKTHPKNYQTHPVDQRAHLRASLRLHDQYKNVVTANDLTLLAGHGLLDAAREEGRTHLVIVRMPYGPDDDLAEQLLAGDNEIERLAHKNDHLLASLLEGLQSRGGGEALLGTGFDTLMLSGLLYEPSPGTRPGLGAGPEPLGEPTAPPSWGVGEPGGMQVIQLVMEETQAEEFEAAVEGLAVRYGTDGLSATLIECVRRAIEREGA